MTNCENAGLDNRRFAADDTSPLMEGDADPTAGIPTSIDRLLTRYAAAAGPSAAAIARRQRIAMLTRAIETQILPKLLVVHRLDRAEPDRPQPLDDAGMKSFTALVLANDLEAGSARMEALVGAGFGLADICLGVLTPAAARLGEMWNDDLCSFVDVTAALGTLQLILYRLRAICAPALPIRDHTRRILLASLSGNQHTFGLQMVAEVFSHSGWNVTVETAIQEADLPALVGNQWFAVAGLSIARDQQTSHLGQIIRGIRQSSANEAIGILVGGPVFATQPNLARLVGADVDACDAKQAVLRAEGLRLLTTSLQHDFSAGQPLPGAA